MLPLIKIWSSIALLRAKPQELPGDPSSVVMAVGMAFATYLLAVTLDPNMNFAVQRAVFDIGLAAVTLYVGLSVFEKPERFSQAFAAYCGSSAVLNVASMLMLSAVTQESAGLTESVPVATAVIMQLSLIWAITVLAHIVRFTFETGIAVSVLLSAAYLLLYISLMSALLVN